MKYFRRHKFITFLSIVFIILVGILLGKNIIGKRAAEKNLLGGLEVENYDEYVKSLSNTPSDIEGMSVYEKYQKGLMIEEGSDSDHDGLTDKEEIEIYGSDPLKASTSDDLYSDSYKVTNNMDLFTSYEYQETEEFAYNECDNVQLTASNPLDFMAVIEDCTNRYSLSDFGINKVYQGYWIYNFSGTLTMDLTDVLKNANITLKDIDISVYEGDFLIYGLSDLEDCKYTSDGDIVTLSYDFNSSKAYYVYVTEKTSMFNSILASHKNGLQLNGSKDEEVAFLAVGSPILSNIKVYYPKRESADADKEMASKANAIFGNEVTYSALDIDKIKDKYNSYKNVLPALETKDGVINNNWALALFGYQYYSEDPITMAANSNDSNGENTEVERYNNYHTSFDPYADELPFQNFESEYATGGNCAGISYLTAYLFNNGSFPNTGEYNGISWDISGDSENDTLVNSGLYDYKTRDFVDNHSGNDSNYIGGLGLTTGESEFVKMIGSYWRETNDKLPKINETMISNEWSNDWKLAENMMNYLDQGKILYVGLYLNSGIGHAINVYDYYFVNEDELIFRVYDCNIPQIHLDNYTLNCDGACYLQCKKILRSDGTYGLSYLYYPIQDNLGYMASSDYDLMRNSSIMVADENWNSLN